MIANSDRTTLVSSIGWVDNDALWRFDVSAARAERIDLGSGARYLSLHSFGCDHFAVCHHFDEARFELTVHGFSDPVHVLARAILEDDQTRFAGDSEIWKEVPRLYVEYLGAPWRDFVLLMVSPLEGHIEVQQLEWYDNTYDKIYQGVLGVLELPGEDTALVSVQRSSVLVLHDLATGRKKGSVTLGGRGGNPSLQLRKGGNEIWASDYDALVVLERKEWRIVRSARLQGAAAGAQQFIGDFSFSPDEQICVVARPFHGDIVGIDAATLKIRLYARVGQQPLEVAALPRREVVARD